MTNVYQPALDSWKHADHQPVQPFQQHWKPIRQQMQTSQMLHAKAARRIPVYNYLRMPWQPLAPLSAQV